MGTRGDRAVDEDFSAGGLRAVGAVAEGRGAGAAFVGGGLGGTLAHGCLPFQGRAAGRSLRGGGGARLPRAKARAATSRRRKDSARRHVRDRRRHADGVKERLAIPTSGRHPWSRIRIGIGGWTFEPWRETFYPDKLPAKRELEYASRKLTAIEVNGTYYSTMSASSFARWHDETPDDFVFSLKANRFATNRRVLAEAGESIERFIGSGLARLREKLGPIVWQFAPTKKFDAADFEAFVKLLPREIEGQRLRHVLDVRHASFMTPEFLALARRHGCAAVITDSPDYPSFANLTADFVYLRLMQCESGRETGYAPEVLDAWAACARRWADGGEPEGLPLVADDTGAPAAAGRDVFMFMINGAKERAPAAAMEVIARVREPGTQA